MKRSEMIAILQGAFHVHTNCTDDCCLTGIDIYDKVLRALEEAGMQPPLREKLVTLVPYEDGEWTSFAYEWEAE